MRRLLEIVTQVAPTFDADLPWILHSQVSVRPEPFGALLYHFGNRRLSFLKDLQLLAVVRALPEQPSAHAAMAAVGIPPEQTGRFTKALAGLAASDILIPAPAPAQPSAVETP